ncbi:MAG: EAL domain-containing protein [Gammaproteobacteria bacterium]
MNVIEKKIKPEGAAQNISSIPDALKHSKILMVDDEPITTEILQTFLEDAGYQNFVSTSDSTKAVELIRNTQPDVVLLDLVMPEVNGFDILAVLRSEEGFLHIPVVVLTSSTDATTKLKALELGANDFLSKPVDPSELALRIKNTLAAKAFQDRLTNYDALTGLPNRRYFSDSLQQLIQVAKMSRQQFLILHLNIDSFKKINETLGASAGDALLQKVAVRIEEVLKTPELTVQLGHQQYQLSLFRTGGDEFTMLVPDIRKNTDAGFIATKLMCAFNQAFYIADQELFVSPSIGIGVYPDDGENVEILLQHSNVALSHAKNQGGNLYQYYSKNLNAASLEKLQMGNQLRTALENNQLVMHYQPKVDLQSGEIIGMEALMRWEHPELGMVSPIQFIPIAEESNLIITLSEWAILEAARNIKQWNENFGAELTVAVNITSKHLKSNLLVDTVKNILQKVEIPPRFLELEITENVILDNADSNIQSLKDIRSLGIKIALDDFGTGYSSLSYLIQFPLDILKIDRSFVINLHTSQASRAIVSAIIAMAQGLGLFVVVEGIETEEQLQFFQQRHCDFYQGYLFSRPVPANEFTKLLEAGNYRKAGEKNRSLPV